VKKGEKNRVFAGEKADLDLCLSLQNLFVQYLSTDAMSSLSFVIPSQFN